MSNSGEEFCRRDRLSYRQNHQIPGAASATDRYNVSLYDSPDARPLPVYESLSDPNKRHHRTSPTATASAAGPPASYDVDDARDRCLSASSYNYHHHRHHQPQHHYHHHHQHHHHHQQQQQQQQHRAAYDLNNHRLPPLPPSPNHYALDAEESFIPPPDCYLSPPAPAPPDPFQSSLSGRDDAFLLSTSDLYAPAIGGVDKYQKPSSGIGPLAEKYRAPSPDGQADGYPDHQVGARYSGSGGSSYVAAPGDPYVLRRDLGYHNHYRLLNSAHHHQKSTGFASSSLQRFPGNSRASSSSSSSSSSAAAAAAAAAHSLNHHQYQTLKLHKCCGGSYARDPQSLEASPSGQNRIRTSSRTSSPVAGLAAPVTPSGGAAAVDSAGCGSSGGRYLSAAYASTLPRCNSYGDMQGQGNGNPVGTFRRTPSGGHENCCYRRRTSSPSSSSSSASAVAYSLLSLSYSTATSTVSASGSASSLCSQNFQPPTLPTFTTSTWKSEAANSGSPIGTPVSSTNLANNLLVASASTATSTSTSASASASASTSTTTTATQNNNSASSNVNSPSLSFSSSRSSPSLTTVNTTNTTASATTSPTAISTNSGGSSALMDHHTQPVQRSVSAPAPASVTEYDEESTSPSTEMADDSLSSTNESLTSPHHRLHQAAPPQPPPPNHALRNPPASLPVQSAFDRPHHAKHPLQHQISAPVTGSNVASSRRYSRSISKKELIKNYIKKETAVFFGVHEPTEENERARWLDRRKRLAYRTYGQLKNEYQIPSACSTLQKPDVLPLTSSQRRDKTDDGTDERDAADPRSIESTLKRKPSVARMTFDGVAYVVSTLGRHRRRPSSTSRQWSRSYAPSSVPPTPSSPLDDEVFFDRTSFSQDDFHSRSLGTTTVTFSGDLSYDPSSTLGGIDQVDSTNRAQHRFTATAHRIGKEKFYTWRRPSQRLEDDQEPQIGLSRIWSRFLDRIFDNSDRRQYGMGVVGRVFGRSIKRSVVNTEPIKAQIEDLEDHRPFFTYWVTTVQILILALSIFAYGLGPVGFDLTQRSGLVLVTSLSLQQVEYSEPSNFWIGPRAADLIHMGAKFAPCMRKDMKIIKEIEKMRSRERDTACCIRNDDSGCVQASQAECSKAISTWKKWSSDDIGPNGRVSGSVCGLDPKFCEAPASVAPHEWPDDITKWPICRKMSSRFSVQTMSPGHHGIKKDKMAAAEHMVCEVIGHPCCIGIHGTCRITTKEYCDFVRGYFHEDASLCSQVSCLDDVCGMIPFYVPEAPDQFYRLWTSLFIHAGVLHLAITVFIQYFFMRDLEKLTGSLRIAFIYIGSGVAGNLASAIFVPYRADVGPAGAQFGLLACLVVEVLNCWPMLKHPLQALVKLLAVTSALFLFGLLPWVDNFAHLFGFGFGFLLSYALLPFVSFGPYDRHRKIFFIWVCLLSSLCFFVLLVLLFYLIPFYDCELCHYLNCIPLTRDFCATQNINFKREEYVV